MPLAQTRRPLRQRVTDSTDDFGRMIPRDHPDDDPAELLQRLSAPNVFYVLPTIEAMLLPSYSTATIKSSHPMSR